MQLLAGIAAAALALIGYPSYVRGVREGSTRPAVASWWAWFLSAVIVTVGQIGARSGWAVLLAAAQAAGLGVVLVAARRRSRWEPSGFDGACIAVAVSGACCGLLISSPNLAVAAAIAGNVIAGVPTYRSVWSRPEDESPWLWLCCGAAGGLAVVAAPAFTIADAGYGIYILVADLGIGLLALRGQRRHHPSRAILRLPVPDGRVDRPHASVQQTSAQSEVHGVDAHPRVHSRSAG